MSPEPMPSSDVDPVNAGLRGRCPRCGEGRLYGGILRLAPACPDCGLDYEPLDQADGPAFFVMLIVGLVIAGLALYVEFVHGPPVWVHILLWPIVALALSLPLLRLSKGLMVGLQYRHKAEQGRLVRSDDE